MNKSLKHALMSGGKRCKTSKTHYKGGFFGIKNPLSPASVGGKKKRGGKSKKGGNSLTALTLLGSLLATGSRKNKSRRRRRKKSRKRN